MSRTEAHIGKIRKVDVLEDETFEQICLRLWLAEGEKEELYDKGELFDEYSEKYMRLNGEVWEVIEDKEFDPEDSYCELTFNEDGSVSYSSVFYNGGACLAEMIEWELKRLKI